MASPFPLQLELAVCWLSCMLLQSAKGYACVRLLCSNRWCVVKQGFLCSEKDYLRVLHACAWRGLSVLAVVWKPTLFVPRSPSSERRRVCTCLCAHLTRLGAGLGCCWYGNGAIGNRWSISGGYHILRWEYYHPVVITLFDKNQVSAAAREIL